MSNLQERNVHLDWESLRLVLEIDRHGGLNGAAKALGVQHSTIFRRLEQLEDRLQTRLFERSRQGYSANAHGEALVEAAIQMERAALEAERRVVGADQSLAGEVRLATSESLAGFLLAPIIGEFSRSHPGISVQLSAENRHVDLSRMEADLALRPTRQPPESMIGRELCKLTFGMYASCELAQTLIPDQPSRWPWLGLSASLANSPQARFMRERLQVTAQLSFDSIVAIASAARYGNGVAALPCFLALQMPELVLVGKVDAAYFPPLWILHHPDLRRSARVRALADYLAATIPDHLQQARQTISNRSKAVDTAACPRRRRGAPKLGPGPSFLGPGV